jgi:hypothetical protein
LGRICRSLQLFQYRWEILCDSAESDSDTDSDCHGYGYTGSNGYCYFHTCVNGNTNAYVNSDSEGCTNIAAWPNFDRQTYSTSSVNTAAHPEWFATSYPRTAPLAHSKLNN